TPPGDSRRRFAKTSTPPRPHRSVPVVHRQPDGRLVRRRPLDPVPPAGGDGQGVAGAHLDRLPVPPQPQPPRPAPPCPPPPPRLAAAGRTRPPAASCGRATRSARPAPPRPTRGRPPAPPAGSPARPGTGSSPRS